MSLKIFSAFVLVIVLPLNNVIAGKSVTLVPINGKSVILVINDKEKEYYSISHQIPVKLQVDGPGKLMIISRVRLPKTSNDAEKYSVRVMEGRNTLKIQTTQADRSEAKVSSSDDVPGKSRKFSLNVPEGSFTYEFWVDDSPREVFLRFLMESSKTGKNLIALEPLSYDKIVTAKINENLVAYYVASKEHVVQLRVVGPTEVEVNARLNYDERMKGEQKFSLNVSEKEKVVTRQLLQTTKSVGLSYEDWAEVVPGKPNKFSITVPEGEHTYQFSLGESIAKSISLKFSIPKRDLNNEE